jgi:hypothetical protein
MHDAVKKSYFKFIPHSFLKINGMMHSSVLGLALKSSAIPWSVDLICPPPDYTVPTRRNEPSSKTQNDCKENGDYNNNFNGGNNNNNNNNNLLPQTQCIFHSPHHSLSQLLPIRPFQNFQTHHQNSEFYLCSYRIASYRVKISQMY